ncbi:MAG TPA: major capsid protein [Acidimicrobiales bacterium]|nr:major capsid protein [Acidimicrobiales bacterium]
MLWTDLIDPATLTGYARESLADYEARQGSLNRWLPNRPVPDVVVRFIKGRTGLVDTAKFRAYDAEPEIGKRLTQQRVSIELPALGENRPVTEYEQLRARGGNLTAEEALLTIQGETRWAVRSVSDAMEYMRGVVIATGVATIDQDNFESTDDFGRPAGNETSVNVDWDEANADGLEDLQEAIDAYETSASTLPGALLMSRRAFRSLAGHDVFRTTLIGGAERRASDSQVRDIVSGAGLPPIYLYDRKIMLAGSLTRVLPDHTVYLMPNPVGSDDWQGTDLGATFWGRTLTSTVSDWGIQPSEQPGIVAGVWRNDKPPMGVEVISDAIGLPVLANAELSFALQVLDNA